MGHWIPPETKTVDTFGFDMVDDSVVDDLGDVSSTSRFTKVEAVDWIIVSILKDVKVKLIKEFRKHS